MPDMKNGAAKKTDAEQKPQSPENRGAANAGLFSSQLTTSRSSSPSPSPSQNGVSAPSQKLELNSPNEMLLYLLIQQVQGVRDELAKANAIKIAMIQHEQEVQDQENEILKSQKEEDEQDFKDNIQPMMYL